jgi:dihydrofolate reductase
MTISAIAATARNNVIGKDNQIPWYLPEDLKFFKRTTIGHHIIMGRKNFLSIGRPLPKRTNVVITRDPFFTATGCIMAHSLDEALEIAKRNGEDEAFIIGGGEIYRQSLPYWDKLYLTEVDLEVEGDVFFPEIDESEWEEISSEPHKADEKNPCDFTFRVFERKVDTV